MKKLDAQKISFYEFTCEDSLTNRILSLVSKMEFKDNMSNKISKDDLFFDSELFDWFDKCLDEARKDIGLSDIISLPITSCWANKATKYQAHHYHAHPNSFLSAVFYLTSHDSAATSYILDNYWMKNYSSFQFSHPVKKDTVKIYPKKSTLVMFPSWISHSATALISNETRYTISFNTYLSGEIHDNSADKARFILRPKSVREFVQEMK